LYEDGCESCKPDVFGYTSVIASCAAETGMWNKDERTTAFYVAMKTYTELKKSDDKPNHVTYGTMLKACARLLPPGSSVRRKTVRKIFRECCEAGCVGDMAISRLREAAPEVYKELLQGHSKHALPEEWTCNVNETSGYRKKRAAPKRAEV
jgi:hypothetical protein